jgi:phage terminase large subunit-like protein
LVEHGERINNNIINDDSFYAKIYSMKDNEDWTKESTWYKCNPSLGHTIGLDFFRTEFNRAKEFPRFENAFKTLYLNAWIDSEKSWIPDTAWMLCGDDNIKIEDFKGETCYAGLDLSSTTDLTALVLCFSKNEKYYLFSYPFCPEDNIKARSKNDKVSYDDWVRQNKLTATSGNCTDYDFVLEKLKTLSNDYNISSVLIDRWNSSYLSTKLIENGFNVVAFGQGFASMASPVRALETLVLSKRLVHDNHPVMRWCMSNVILKIDAAGNAKADKAKSRERIDLVVAALMAIDEASKSSSESNGGDISWI